MPKTKPNQTYTKTTLNVFLCIILLGKCCKLVTLALVKDAFDKNFKPEIVTLESQKPDHVADTTPLFTFMGADLDSSLNQRNPHVCI